MKNNTRRNFLKKSTFGAGGLMTLPLISKANPLPFSSDNDINIIGPKKGFTLQVGTLVSMMNFMRDLVLRPVRNLSVRDLDYLHDDDSNSIGAMLWHLAAVERFYQGSTIGKKWSKLPAKENKMWNVAQSLGDEGRAKIKGYDLDFYLDMLKEVRAFSIAEMKNLDDDWLMEKDNFWGSPTNNYCKWFHVVEHESNHNGQIKYIKSRLHSR